MPKITDVAARRDADAATKKLRLEQGHTEIELRAMLDLFTRGVEVDNPNAQFELGTWLIWGVKPVLKANPRKGLALLKKAALAGVAEAALSVAICVRNGAGCKSDPQSALAWFLRAALLGSRDAMGELAKIYFNGLVVPKSLVVAKIWEDAANEKLLPIRYDRNRA
jgi:uncharacterized protein